MEPGDRIDSVQVVWSPALALGSTTGVALLLRPGRLIGALKPTTATVVLTIGGHAGPVPGGPIRETQVRTIIRQESVTKQFVSKDPEEARRYLASMGLDLNVLKGSASTTIAQTGPPPPGATVMPRPAEMIAELERAKIFEIPAEEIDGIEVNRPDPSGWGTLVIRARRGVEVVNVAPPLPNEEDILTKLVPILEGFAPGRVVRRP